MEIIEKYWYIALGLLIVVFVFAKNKGQGNVTQISTGVDPVALAQIATSERESDENRKFGLAETILNYNLNNRQQQIDAELARAELGQRLDLAKITSDANALALRYSMDSENARLAAQRYAIDSEASFNRFAIDRTNSANSRAQWAQAITSNIPTILGAIFGNQQGSGTWQTPPTFPSGSTFPRFRFSF